jgi:hypothetical protein
MNPEPELKELQRLQHARECMFPLIAKLKQAISQNDACPDIQT